MVFYATPINFANLTSLVFPIGLIRRHNIRLHNIEADLFFPWMREKVTSDNNEKQVSAAFAAVMDQLEEDRQKVAHLGQSIVS